MDTVEIIPYKSEYSKDFKAISYAWLDKYFGIEEEDRLVLENHKTKS